MLKQTEMTSHFSFFFLNETYLDVSVTRTIELVFPRKWDKMFILITPRIQPSQQIWFLKYFPKLNADILSTLLIINGHFKLLHLFLTIIFLTSAKCLRARLAILRRKQSAFFLTKCCCSYSIFFYRFGSYTFN